MTINRPDLGASISHARAVADAVLYEGYLLYPYRATSRKNQVRWQFGVIGPPGAAEGGIGEPSTMACEFLMRTSGSATDSGSPTLRIQLRFLQHQTRSAEQWLDGSFVAAPDVTVGDQRWISWDEAAEGELDVGPLAITEATAGIRASLTQPGGEDFEELADAAGQVVGRLVRRCSELTVEISMQTKDIGAGRWRVRVQIENTSGSQPDKDMAISTSFIGTHLVVVADGAHFLSSVDPPDDVQDESATLTQHRCWPVLAGPAGETRILLVSPIIVEDNAELAPQSAGALFDSTEIDEILTLRVMTLTDEEKAEARATDPRAAEIIDRCDQMTPQQMHDLHGILRNPHGIGGPGLESYDLPDDLVFTTDAPWWDPEADARASPATDTVVIDGVGVSAGCMVRVKPNRRADAHDVFYAGMTARVTAVLNDVDGDTHVAVVLVDDPAAEMHEWYGRYLYFAPDELVPLSGADATSPKGRGDQT